MQKEQSAKLDTQENERRKRLLSAAQGVRAYSGSPLFRQAPGNTSGASVAASPNNGGGGGGGSTNATESPVRGPFGIGRIAVTR